MSINFPKEQVFARLSFENPWWKTAKVDPFYDKMKRREYFQLLFPLVTERSIKRAVVLMGPRRVGKTVLLFQSIQELLNKGVKPKKICYFSIETPLYNGIALEELLNLFLNMHAIDSSEETYVFFDEIQYLKGWELHLKSLVDSYHNIKFIVSGSAAAALKLKSQESGAGRFTEFILPPLTFHEFLSLTKRGNLVEAHRHPIYQDKIDYTVNDMGKFNEQFLAYINFGGYPELSLSKAMQFDAGRYIRNDIIDKVLMRDLPSLYGISDTQELNSLFTYIAYNSGNEMSLSGISQTSGVTKNTIKKYITYLEAAFLIKLVHRVDQNGKKFKRANFFKIYLSNPSLRAALFSPIKEDDDFMGNMVETAIFAQWQHAQNEPLYYARWKSGEVDMVHLDSSKQKPDWCTEIKWSNRFVERPGELKNINLFCQNHKLDSAIITTINVEKAIDFQDIKYHFWPAAKYCYAVGRNIIEAKQRAKS